jgi:anti-anti-sigma factor
MADGAHAAISVVTLPDEIDLVNAVSVYRQLSAAIRRDIKVVVADLTSTVFCDPAGVREIVHAHRDAAGAGAELRLVVPPGNGRRVLEMMGLDRFLSLYPTLEAARVTT